MPAADARCARVGGGGTTWALAIANVRFWSTVAPIVHEELAAWRGSAASIAERRLRLLAMAKLDHEAFNAEVAATLATLAPRAARTATVRAIVALELLFDYLDGRTEQLGTADPLTEGMEAMAGFVEVLGIGEPASANRESPLTGGDREYVAALCRRVREQSDALPALDVVRPRASEALMRCAQAQVRLHALGVLGARQLQDWASAGDEELLGWREYAAGSASSVLAVHALLAAAADPATSAADATAIDRCYVAVGGLITLMDGLVDQAEDAVAERPGLIGLFPEKLELGRAMRKLLRVSLERAQDTPAPAHHAMTVAGVVAYYGSHPGAKAPGARPIISSLFAELPSTVWPALSVMGLWRSAKRLRAHWRPRSETLARARAERHLQP